MCFVFSLRDILYAICFQFFYQTDTSGGRNKSYTHERLPCPLISLNASYIVHI